MRFLKGKHAFLVATHIDKAHIHNHIIYNSTNLDCTRKFNNFYFSALAVQRLSDLICLEYELSIIMPKPYRERTKRTIFSKRKFYRDILCEVIDQVLRTKPKDFTEFLKKMEKYDYEFKNGKQPAFRKKGQKRFICLRSLGEEYSEENIRAVISGKPVHRGNRDTTQKQFNMIIDIQTKMTEGKTAGYERWAKKFNRKEAAHTVCLLQEKDVENYEDLTALTEKLTTRFSELSDSIKSAEQRMIEIGALQTHINNYAKTRAVYEEYQKSGYSKKCFEEHRDALLLHNEEFHQFLAEKKNAYAE